MNMLMYKANNCVYRALYRTVVYRAVESNNYVTLCYGNVIVLHYTDVK